MDNIQALESFIGFCNSMIIANESDTMSDKKDVAKLTESVENGKIFSKNWDKIKSFIVNEFAKYYIRDCKENITKKEIADNLVLYSVEFLWMSKKEPDRYCFKIFVDLNEKMISKISDDHVPSTEISVSKNGNIDGYIYFDG